MRLACKLKWSFAQCVDMEKLTTIARAYASIARGIDSLMKVHQPFWTERLLLRLVRWICSQRLRELVMVLPEEEVEEFLREETFNRS